MISEKCSELALERALMPTKRRRMRDYATEWPMYDGTVLFHLGKSKCTKSCFLLPNVGFFFSRAYAQMLALMPACGS